VIILELSVVDPCDDDHAADPASPQGPAPDVLLRESGSSHQAGSDQVSSQLTYLIPTWWVILDGAGSAAQRMSVRGCSQHSYPVWTAIRSIHLGASRQCCSVVSVAIFNAFTVSACFRLEGMLFQFSTTRWEKKFLLVSGIPVHACGLSVRGSPVCENFEPVRTHAFLCYLLSSHNAARSCTNSPVPIIVFLCFNGA